LRQSADCQAGARQGFMTACYLSVSFPCIIQIENETTATGKQVTGRFAHFSFSIPHS
jgi:hypothetical protein